MKYGRGFSLMELKAAGLTKEFARTVGIAVDHRRHNKNREMLDLNVSRLNNYKQKMILFPRKADKPKKGQIDDTTADKLKSAEQNTTKGVFSLPKRTKRCKVEALTADMKKFNAYQKLRGERLLKQNFGRRERAAKLAEAAKK